MIVKTKNHNQNTIYNIHAYVTAKNGIMQFVDGTSKRCKSKMEPKVSISNADGKEKKYTATIENANALGKVSSVQFAVWSDTNGQDDLIGIREHRKMQMHGVQKLRLVIIKLLAAIMFMYME